MLAYWFSLETKVFKGLKNSKIHVPPETITKLLISYQPISQYSHSVVSESLQPHGLPYLSSTPRVYSNSCPSVSDAIQPSHPLSSPSPPALYLSQHQGLYSESALHFRWPKYWSFSFSISPSSEYSGLISFRMDWLDLLVVQGTL